MTNVEPIQPRTRRRPTATSEFGVGRREAHDASSFYARFTPPRLSDDSQVAPPAARDAIWTGDAREMDRFGEVADNSVALVVTSPPYFAGKEYEAVLGVGHVPADYHAYLAMLHDVFGQCFDKLEPGGRIAVNVANLGRKPYRSLSRDVIDLLERLGFLLRRGDHLAEEPRRRRDRAPGAPTSDRATRCCATCPNGSSWPPRAGSTGPSPPTSAPAKGSPARGPSPWTSSSTPPSTSGTYRPNRPPGSATRRRSRWSCPAGSSSSTPIGAISSSIRSSAPARPPSPPSGPSATTSDSTPTRSTSRWPSAGSPTNGRRWPARRHRQRPAG